MSSEGRREREIPVIISSHDILREKELYTPGQSDYNVFTGRQITVSESHPRTNGKYESGGPFYTVSRTYDIPTRNVKMSKKEFGTEYSTSGTICTPLTSVNTSRQYLEEFRPRDTSDLDPKGATAISLCSPTNSVASLATGLAETYREVLPALPGVRSWQERTRVALAAGSEFLNAQFGWLPLVGEVTDVGHAARHSRDILNQYHRDQGKLVRRRFYFDIDKDSSSFNAGFAFPLQNGGETSMFAGNNPGRLVGRLESSTRVWFSGAFTYAVPSSTDIWTRQLGYGSDADKLFGITITPEVLWDLTPWSWAADWFSNTGDVLRNVGNFAQNGLIMPYGYVMEESIDKVTYTLEGGEIRINNVSTPIECPPASVTTVSKVRRPANPFGFGIELSDLSTTQLAIAAALGVTLL